jgi:MFS transporter, SP family, galactose:H+ symporter
VLAGFLSDRVGRRRVILGVAMLFIVGAFISTAAETPEILLIGRFFGGLAIGIASMLTRIYLAEISPAGDRGAIVSLNQLGISGGILVSYLVGFALAGAACCDIAQRGRVAGELA